jgi:hypothetical protein
MVKCCYTISLCCIITLITMSVIMLSVIMLSVIMLNV